MPIYAHRCPICGRYKEVFSTMGKRDNPETCVCGTKMERIPAQSSFRLHNDRCGGFTNNSGSVSGG